MKSIIKVFLFLLLSGLSFSANASHYLGGEITWECKTNGQYEFTVIIYLECSSSAQSYVSNILRSSAFPGGQVTLTQISAVDISPTCAGGSGIFCGMTGSGNGAVKKYTLKATVSLTGVPPAGGWEFYWMDSARPYLVNTTESYYYLRAKMYPYTPVGGSTANNANPCYDNSPTFKELGSLTICAGAPFIYNHLASDKDLDSLYVRFASPLGSGGAPASFKTGYSAQAPYPNPNSQPPGGPLTINGHTGEVSMDIPSGATGGSYASCYVIEAWKCGQGPNGPEPILVAEVFRDVVIVVKTGCAANNEPGVEIDTSVYTGIDRTGPKSYTTTVYPGDTIDFELIAEDTDFDPNTNSFQNICFKAAGLQVSNPLSSGTGCDGPAPCASFTPINQSGYCVTVKNTQQFLWVPDCQHLDVGGNYCTPFNTFYFSLRMEDDGCPAPRISLTTLVVKVVAGDPAPLELKCVNHVVPSGDVRLSWDRAIIDSGLGFNYYMVLGATTKNGPYDTLQYITDIDSLGTLVGAGGGYEHFYMIKSTGKCDFLSEPSDTLSVMNMSLTATPPGSAEYASLSWTPLHTPLSYTSAGVYEIWTEAPAGSGNWSQVGSTTDLSYTDTVTVCNSVVNYQIRVTDTVRGCQSMSTIDSAHFSDKTNNDAIVLDSVSVNAAGNSIISWGPTRYNDVVDYYLYFNDPKLGWIVVDTVPVGTPMPHEWTGSQADSRSEQFKVISVDSCGNQSDDQIVKPHRTVYMRNYLNKCEAYARVSWNSYEGFGQIAGYRVLREISQGGVVTSPWTVAFTAGPQDTSFEQHSLQNGYDYCYRVQAFDTTGRTSTSNELCFTAEVPRKSKVLYLARVTNDPGRNALDISTFVDGTADVMDFAVERAPSPMGPFRTIGVVGKPGMAPYVINYLDYGVNPSQRHYYYRLSATDSCGGRDTVSNLARNILLQVTPRPNLTNYLTWNPYINWNGEVARYEIYRKGHDEADYSLVGNTNGDDTTFVDDISDYRETPGNFCYYVKAVEGVGPPPQYTMDNGEPFSSRSNERCINQKARVYIPTAFRPGSDVLENRYFGPSMKFNEVSEYHFFIMNRWGVKVFETRNPEERWDGTYQNTEAQQGVYMYFINYSTPGGIPVEERGNFTLIR